MELLNVLVHRAFIHELVGYIRFDLSRSTPMAMPGFERPA